MTDVRKILYEICENEDVFSDDTDLIENGILDSYGMMTLLSALEDEGIEINIARTVSILFRSVSGIERLISEAKDQ